MSVSIKVQQLVQAMVLLDSIFTATGCTGDKIPRYQNPQRPLEEGETAPPGQPQTTDAGMAAGRAIATRIVAMAKADALRAYIGDLNKDRNSNLLVQLQAAMGAVGSERAADIASWVSTVVSCVNGDPGHAVDVLHPIATVLKSQF